MTSPHEQDTSAQGKISDEILLPSKTERKKEMLALRDCAEFICNLKNEQQAQLPLSSSLTNGLLEYKRLKNKNAQQRHFQFLAKILSETENLHEIESAVDRFRHPHLHQQKIDRAVENSYEKIMSAELDLSQNEINTVINQNREIDRQTLLQFIRNAQKECKEHQKTNSLETQNSKESNTKKHQQKLKKFLRNHFNQLAISNSRF